MSIQNQNDFQPKEEDQENEELEEEEEDPEYEKLYKSKFKQQRFSAWRPNPKISTIAIVFIVFGVIQIIIGVLILVYTKKVQEINIRYDKGCKVGKRCQLTIDIKEDMKKSIFIYYQIDGLTQSHKRYLNSKSEDQLKGKIVTLEEINKTENCYLALTNEEMGFKEGDLSITGKRLKMEELAVPCGLMAKNYFTDKFTNFELDEEVFSPNETEIAWKSEIEYFKNTEDLDKQWVNMTDEHFMIWMRPSMFTDVKKLWGKIEDRDFKAGQKLKITIDSKYDVSLFGGKKRIILSNFNIFGGRNNFLGISYCCLGSVVIITTIIVIICYSVHLRKMKED